MGTMTKKVVLVTGGTGLVGNGIRIAHERDPRDDETFVFLSSKDADLTDKESTRKVFEKHRPTHVIHLAAKVGGLYGNMKANLEFFRINMSINDNILSLCHEYKVEKVISCLSTCIIHVIYDIKLIIYILTKQKYNLVIPMVT